MNSIDQRPIISPDNPKDLLNSNRLVQSRNGLSQSQDSQTQQPWNLDQVETPQEPKIYSIWGDHGSLNHAGVSSNIVYINELYKSLYYLNIGRYMTGSEEPGPSNLAMTTRLNHQSPRFSVVDDVSTSNTLNYHGMLSYNDYGNRNLHRLNFSLLRGQLLKLAQHQTYSVGLCNAIDQGLSTSDTDTILCDISAGLCDVMKNEFGSRSTQKLFGICNSDQINMILKTITKHPDKLIQMCLNSYGSKSMLRLLENVNTPAKMQFITAALSRGAVVLCNDSFGNHVVKYCVSIFPWEYNQHLFIAIANNCYEVATHKIGCVVLKACVENSDGKSRARLITAIVAIALTLAENPYGNYVVQHLIELKIPKATLALLSMFQGHFASLSCDKFASNVVQKLVSSSPGGGYISSEVIIELVQYPEFSSLVIDPFANYVIQSALSASTGLIHDALVQKIEENRTSMEHNIYGERILAWFEKRRH